MVEDLPPLALRYLEELGLRPVDLARGSAETLVRVHRAHALRFAHDTVWMARGRVPAADHEVMVTSLLDGEGGACVNLNAGLAWLLGELDLPVTLHRARVVQGFEETPTGLNAHLVLQVATDQGTWVADTGLGAGLLDPLPLVPGAYRQGSYDFSLARSDHPGLSHRLRVDRRLMGVHTIEWEPVETDLAALEASYLVDSSGPDSAYVQHLTAHRRTVDGVLVLTDRVVVRVADRKRRMERITTPQRWEQVLREEFHLGLPELTPAELTELWERSGRATHPSGSPGEG